jgi:cytochrome c-type biogenesis protein
VILGGILTLAAREGSAAQGAVLLAAYTLGLGVPFLLIAALYDRAPALIGPLVRHGRAVSIVGGVLVILIGIAMLFDWLALLPQFVPFNSQI